MSDLRYPNETEEYRAARDALLKEEKALVEKVKALAAKRRELPLGGKLKEDYVFIRGERGQGWRRGPFVGTLWRQIHADSLQLHVWPGLGQPLPVLHIIDGWL